MLIIDHATRRGKMKARFAAMFKRVWAVLTSIHGSNGGVTMKSPIWSRLGARVQFLNGRSSGRAGFRGKTLWDVLQLLIIPVALAIATLVFNYQNSKIEREVARRNAESERTIAEDTRQETALQAYLDRMTDLLLKEDLRDSKPEDEVRTVARTRTLTVLRGLEKERKAAVVWFLVESKLVSTDPQQKDGLGPIVSLSGADLYEADLRGAVLTGADLRGAVLTEAVLFEADLREADLRGADLTEADLYEADLRGAVLTGAVLKGAMLPDGSTWTEGTDMSRFTNPPSDTNE
jgi:hypothetical protein